MLKNLLPDYLKVSYHGAPNDESVVICGGVRLTVITPRLIRIETGAWTDEATTVVVCRDFCQTKPAVTREGDTTLVDTGALKIRYTAGLPLEEGLVICREEAPAFTWHYGDKPLNNLGGTTSTLDEVNGACAIEDGVCAVDGFAFIDDSASPLIREDGWFAPREACTDVYFFGYGRDYTACVQDYYRLTGIPEMLPAYALGNWWSRYHAYTDKEYLDLMDRFHQLQVPLSVGIIDMDWHITNVKDHPRGKNSIGGWTGYTWNEELFPDYRAFIQGLHDRGLRTAMNLHPALGVQPHEVQYDDMLKALDMDPATDKTIPFNCLDPKFLKAYFEVLLFPYERDGVDFWWMDWQQGTDYAKIIGEGYRPTGLEGITPLWMLNHTHYAAAKRNGKRGMIFSRYSGYGSQRYPIGFSGDTYITWDSLNFQPYFTVTASNVGYSWWSHDIGGHMNGTRDSELHARWVQFGVFSPIFRLHTSSHPLLGHEPWKYNKRCELIVEDYMRLRHRMFPYLYTMAHRNYAELLPLMRPMYHVHPDAKDAYQVPNQYYFGSEMIVAPITEPADDSDLARVNVWLPEGKWIDAQNGYVYRGNTRFDAFRTMEQMPLFIKAGGIVPMQAHVPGDNGLGKREHMEVYVTPGADGAFDLYEDDGESMAYKQGDCCLTPMQLTWQEKEAAFRIAPIQGNAAYAPAQRRWDVHFRGWRKGCTFMVNGEAVPAAYDAETNTYTVVLEKVDAAVGAAITVQHVDALIHDNHEWHDRFIDALTRAKRPLEIKMMLMELYKYTVEGYEKTGKMPRGITAKGDPNLSGYGIELLMHRG